MPEILFCTILVFMWPFWALFTGFGTVGILLGCSIDLAQLRNQHPLHYRGPNDHINSSFLQTMISGMTFVVALEPECRTLMFTRSYGPYTSVRGSHFISWVCQESVPPRQPHEKDDSEISGAPAINGRPQAVEDSKNSEPLSATPPTP